MHKNTQRNQPASLCRMRAGTEAMAETWTLPVRCWLSLNLWLCNAAWAGVMDHVQLNAHGMGPKGLKWSKMIIYWWMTWTHHGWATTLDYVTGETIVLKMSTWRRYDVKNCRATQVHSDITQQSQFEGGINNLFTFYMKLLASEEKTDILTWKKILKLQKNHAIDSRLKL